MTFFLRRVMPKEKKVEEEICMRMTNRFEPHRSTGEEAGQ